LPSELCNSCVIKAEKKRHLMLDYLAFEFGDRPAMTDIGERTDLT